MNNNLFDYLEWRGNLTFKDDGFNEVDNLVLSIISYMDFTHIIPKDLVKSITLREAEQRLIRLKREHQKLGLIIPEKICDYVILASKSKRYADIKVTHFVQQLDESVALQFSAMTFELPDKTLFISYRGTDDTLVGWKENFNMSFIFPIPAQAKALDYLIDVASHKRGKIRLGGHSKGGNLAVWAAVNAGQRLQNRIISVYNNDGPGFAKKIMELPEYRSIEDRIVTFVPESSVIGMLLEHSEDYYIVKSTQITLWQHDPFSWVIKGNEFIKAEKRSSFSMHVDKALSEWLVTIPPNEKQHIIELLFSTLEATGAKTLSEVNENKLKSISTIIKSLNTVDKQTKERVSSLIKKLFEFESVFHWK